MLLALGLGLAGCGPCGALGRRALQPSVAQAGEQAGQQWHPRGRALEPADQVRAAVSSPHRASARRLC